MGNKRYPAEQWAEWVEVACQFGLSVAEVFDAIGVSASSFCRWRTKLLTCHRFRPMLPPHLCQ